MGRLSSITLRINPGWGAGILHYSQYAATQQPFDDFKLFVDGRQRDAGPNRFNGTGFEERDITLSPDSKNVTWVYEYNPGGFPAGNVPPEQDDRIAAVFLDNVYFDPFINPEPIRTPTPTTAPTGDIDEAIYFMGFEKGSIDMFPEWSSEGGAVWERTSEEAASGVFSVRSPNLKNELFEQRLSSITLQINPGWGAGILHYSQYAATQQPFDDFKLFVDGRQRDAGPNRFNGTGFEERDITLSPDSKNVTWVYEYNPGGFPAGNVPPEQDD